MRYVVLPLEGEWAVSNESEANEYRDHFFIFHGTEAQAHIFAWALNQIADGRLIVSLASPQELAPAGTRYAGYYCIDYTGSTDGVAQ